MDADTQHLLYRQGFDKGFHYRDDEIEHLLAVCQEAYDALSPLPGPTTGWGSLWLPVATVFQLLKTTLANRAAPPPPP
ncbi:hypothetical protein LCGC14_1252000 [marine sediment metagenome]|uniref:Uncharacterized protein n=1 Tax=marine sediment metagenome TaxID=412755 RepID=A0A0F9P6Q2_9ZZZZ